MPKQANKNDSEATLSQKESINDHMEVGYQQMKVLDIELDQYRGLHKGKVAAMIDAMKQGTNPGGWLPSSSITVKRVAGGKVRVVDGLHRLTSVRARIASKEVSADFTVPCLVVKQDCPRHLVVAFTAIVNTGHLNAAPMTFVDRVRWLAYYMVALASESHQWYTISAKKVADSLVNQKGESPPNYSKPTIEKARGCLLACRKNDLYPNESLPVLARPSSPWNVLMLLDELDGSATFTVLMQYQPALTNAKATGNVRQASSLEDKEIFTIGNCYPNLWTVDALDKLSEEEIKSQVGQRDRMSLLLWMYVGHLARTGNVPTHDEAVSFVHRITTRPEITIAWKRLQRIAEPSGLIVQSRP